MKNIKLIVMDVDGTMTDGGIYFDSNGVEIKKFNVHDGAGILLAQQVGIEFMILTGRKSVCVGKRAKELKIKYLYQGISDKLGFLEEFIQQNEFEFNEIAYIGDDLNDYGLMSKVGVKVCPNNAVQEIKDICDIQLSKNGGCGAIREFVEILLKYVGSWRTAVEGLFGVKLEEQVCQK